MEETSRGDFYRKPYSKRMIATQEIEYPTIAQLVERPTVEVMWLSGGPWFESGWSDVFFSNFLLHLQTLKNENSYLLHT